MVQGSFVGGFGPWIPGGFFTFQRGPRITRHKLCRIVEQPDTFYLAQNTQDVGRLFSSPAIPNDWLGGDMLHVYACSHPVVAVNASRMPLIRNPFDAHQGYPSLGV